MSLIANDGSVVLFFGKPGSGKSTVAKKVEESFRLSRISTGDIIRRNNVDEQNVSQGNFVDDKTVNNIFKNIFLTHHYDNNSVVLDGYPRNTEQLEFLRTLIYPKRKIYIINLYISDDTALGRMLERCRADDEKEIISKRFTIFEKKTKPVIDQIKSRSVFPSQMFITIDVSEKSIADVTSICTNFLNSY
jgi:adenylate kinase family enzyme